MLSGLLGRKMGMTQVFGKNGAAIPVTVIEAGPCVVTQVKTAAKDGYEAVQLGFGKARRAKRPALGHLGHSLPLTERQRRKQQQERAKSRQQERERRAAEAQAEEDEGAEGAEETEEVEDAEDAEEAAEAEGEESAEATETQADEAETKTVAPAAKSAQSAQKPSPRRRRGTGKALGPFALLREVKLVGGDAPAVGDEFKVNLFTVGEHVDVIGTSKGKGFAGVMKRHGFGGGPRTHGQSDRARRPGSIGPGTTPGRVYKGTRMAGRMGHERVTVKALEVVQADPERNLLLVKGSVPGANGTIVMIRKGAAQLALAARSGATVSKRA